MLKVTITTRTRPSTYQALKDISAGRSHFLRKMTLVSFKSKISQYIFTNFFIVIKFYHYSGSIQTLQRNRYSFTAVFPPCDGRSGIVLFSSSIGRCGIPLNYLCGFKAECTHCILSDYNLYHQLFKEKVPFCFACLISSKNKSPQALSLISCI